MTKKRRPKNEDAWKHAKALCRLSARQIEMAHALGMNPMKLPGLRPSAQQRWKAPVGQFIEKLYEKRFGGKDSRIQPTDSKPRQGPSRASAEPADTIKTTETTPDPGFRV